MAINKMYCLLLIPCICFLSIFKIQAQGDTAFSKTLPDVKVTATKKALKESARGAILDISKIPDAKLLSLAEVLRMIPGLEVDEIAKKITYMGKDVAIQRNGVNFAGFNQQINYDLNNLTATQYAKIALNLYDLKTEQPTISFDVKHTPNAWFGSGNTGIDIDKKTRFSASGYLSRGRHIVNIFGNGDVANYKLRSENYSDMLYHTTGIREKYHSTAGRSAGSSYTTGISHNFSISPQDILNTSVSINQNRSSSSRFTERSTYSNEQLLDSNRMHSTASAPLSGNYGFNAILNYTHFSKEKPSGKQRWDFSAEYNNNRNNRLNEYISEIIQSKNDYKSQDWSANQSIFVLGAYQYDHIKLGNFESVIKYFRRNEDKNFNFSTPEVDGSFTTLKQGYNIGYDYAAWLASWDKSFGKLSLRAVVKSDYNNTNVHDKQENFNNHYFGFAPYLSLFRQMKNGSLRWENQFAQKRPPIEYLSTITEFYSQYSTSGTQNKGNPNLTTAKNLNSNMVYNTTIREVNLVVSASYAHEWNPFISYLYTEDTLLIRSYRNIKFSRNYNGNLSLNFYAFPRFSVRLFASLGATQYIISSDSLKDGNRWNTGTTLSYVIGPSFRLSVSGNYGASKMFQGKTLARLNTSFSCSYTKNRFNISLMANHFHRPYFKSETYYTEATFSRYSYSYNRMLGVSLSFSYSLGKSKPITKGKDIQKDDI